MSNNLNSSSEETNGLQDYLSIKDIFRIFQDNKILILYVTLAFASLAFLYGKILPDIYRADVTLIESAQQTAGSSSYSSSSQLSGLASLAGLKIEKNYSDTDLAISLLKSRKFLQGFSIERKIVEDLTGISSIQFKELSEREKIKTLENAAGSLKGKIRIFKDFDTPVYKLYFRHSDPEKAQTWANWIVEDLNKIMREDEVKEAELSIKYLQEKANSTQVSDLKQLFYSMIQAHTRTTMLAEVRDDYAFKVLDPAILPRSKDSPNRFKIFFWGVFIGLSFGMVLSLLLHFLNLRITFSFIVIPKITRLNK